MTNRRRFTAEFKARAALEACGATMTIHQIDGHKVHPNLAWKLPRSGRSVFCRDHESEVRVHAKIRGC